MSQIFVPLHVTRQNDVRIEEEQSQWPQRFLIGLLLSLVTLFVALEYTITPDDPLDDADLLEQIGMDPELSPLLRPENELALAPKAEPKPATRLVVADDGHGFDVHGQRPGGTGYLGIVNMRERVAAFGGEFHIDSGAGGTTVRVSVPLEQPDAQGGGTCGS